MATPTEANRSPKPTVASRKNLVETTYRSEGASLKRNGENKTIMVGFHAHSSLLASSFSLAYAREGGEPAVEQRGGLPRHTRWPVVRSMSVSGFAHRACRVSELTR